MNTSQTLQQLLEDAVRHHQAGELDRAEALYGKVLELNPAQVDALNLLGVIAQQTGDLDRALELFDRAMAAAPALATVPFNKANALREAGQTTEAHAAYEAALVIDPKYTDALLNLGALQQESGETARAIATFNRLLEIAPDTAQAHYNIGKCRHVQGRLDDAQSALAKAISLDPAFADAHFAMASLLADQDKPEIAIDHIKTAIKLKPKWAEAISTHGLLLARMGQFDEAIELCEKAIALEPSQCVFHFQLGRAYHLARRYDLARQVFKTAMLQEDANERAIQALASLAVDNTHPWLSLNYLNDAMGVTKDTAASANLLNNIGSMFLSLELTSAALVFFEAACAAEPKLDTTRLTLGKAKFRRGYLLDSYADFKHALTLQPTQKTGNGNVPIWQGEDLSSKTILVLLDRGIGDQILYATMIPDLIEMSDRCIIECSKRLIPILARTFPDADVTDWLDESVKQKNRSDSDYFTQGQFAVSYVRPSFQTFERSASMLAPDPDIASKIRRRYVDQANGKRIVGIAWLSGSQYDGPYKSIDLEYALSQFDSEDTFFVSLQYGNVEKQTDKVAEQTGVKVFFDPSVDQLKDMEPYLAQVAAMDLVITISNTTAHVAGGLGVPTWLMLPRGAGVQYFWFLDRRDSPWYPSVRVFRQKSKPDFNKAWGPEVVDDVAAALRAWESQPLTRQLGL